MMTVGKPISAGGAQAYFKADFAKQATLQISAEQHNRLEANHPSDEVAAAEADAPTSADAEIENVNAQKLKNLEGENADAESDSTENSESAEMSAESLAESSEKDSAESLIDRNSAAEISAVEGSASKNLSDQNFIEEPHGADSANQNSSVRNSNEQSNSAENDIDFARTRTRWIGKLSEEIVLTGEVSEKEFAALARGVHPQTGERFIRHVKARTVTDESGKIRQTKTHRAGLDQTLNAPKSVSLVAPYDERIIAAHWCSAIKAIETIEEFTTAKMGNVKPPEKTGKAAYAAFLHFEARPDFKSGYAAPDLHTHFFEFNFSPTADGKYRALETREIYRSQKLATAVYRSELIKELTKIGYEMRIDGKTGAPEIASISRDYIEASSPRQAEIKRTAEDLGIKSTKIVASNYRRGKDFDPVAMRRRWDALDAEFGGQAAKAAAAARLRTEEINLKKQTPSSHQPDTESLNSELDSGLNIKADTAIKPNTKSVVAVDFALAQAKEQTDTTQSKRKWITRQSLLTDALTHSLAEITVDEVKTELIEREKNGELVEFALDRRGMKKPSKSEKAGVVEGQLIEPDTNKTNSSTKNEAGLNTKKESEQLIERNYDETGTVQSGIRTNEIRRARVEVNSVGDHHRSGESSRSFKRGEFEGRNESLESDIAGFDAAVNTADDDEFARANGTVESNSADFGGELQQKNGDSRAGNQGSGQQNSVLGGGERELSNRSGSFGNGKSDDEQILGQSSETGANGGSEQSALEPSDSIEIANAVKAKPNSQSPTAELEKPSFRESGAGVAQIKIAGTEFTALRDYRTDDETTRGRQEITGNDGENFGEIGNDRKENSISDGESEHGTDRREKRDGESQKSDSETQRATGTSRTADELGETTLKSSGGEFTGGANQSGEIEVANGGGFESKGSVGSRISNANKRGTGSQIERDESSKLSDAGADKPISPENSRGERRDDLEGSEIKEENAPGEARFRSFNRTTTFSDAGDGLPVWNEQGFERGSGSGKSGDAELTRSIDSNENGEKGGRAKFRQHDSDASASIAGGRKILQSVGGGADENNSVSIEENRRTAEKTAQIINVKRFSGGLEPQIVAEWTAIIEKSNAAEFLSEIVKPKGQPEQQQIFEHLDAQAALIAAKLKLPKPVPEAEPNARKLAAALTQIEVANYQKTAGETVSGKTFEVLVAGNSRCAAVAPPTESPAQIQEIFGSPVVEPVLKSSSALESAALAALLDPVKHGYDASAFVEAQQLVKTNEAAARETATLIQIAYGGQTDKFTDNFKNDLAERIYSSPIPAIENYRNFRQFDWQETINGFAPFVNQMAEQSKIEIKPPESDAERNKLLADFAARQLVEAHESQNGPLAKYIQNQMTASFLQAGNIEVYQSQKDTIAALTDQNLKPPEFSKQLEASAYNLTKYDDEKKADLATRIADQIRVAEQIKAEKHEASEMEEVQVLTMR